MVFKIYQSCAVDESFYYFKKFNNDTMYLFLKSVVRLFVFVFVFF